LEKERAANKLQQQILKLFQGSSYTTGFIGLLLNICFDQGFNLSAQVLSDAAVKSFNFHAGIALLEKQIQQNDGNVHTYIQ
jgi:hypothetical protein